MTAPAEVLTPAYAPGRLIDGRFRIEAQLARGGAGVVYSAYDERTQRRVALKQLVVPAVSTTGLLETQFEREFYTLSQLSHPSIIEVYDYGVDAGTPYYTMELLEGRDLRQLSPLSFRQACAVLRDVASCLAILHARRLLHRDLSARNVIVSSSGRAKLIDFGSMTPMGPNKHIVGTPPFVAPESLQLQSLDGRADLYSLGALAFFMLTGTHAYPARTLPELAAQLRIPPPPVHQYVEGVPDALDALVQQLLQADRAARPRTAAEVMERLSGIAGLAFEAQVEVGKAYLVAPMLVGRSAPLERVRKELRGGRASEGSLILIEGPAGSGRSRMLDAAVLEAKLLGALVVRADSSDGARGDYATVRALSEQLHAALPAVTVERSVSMPPGASMRPVFSQLRTELSRGELRHVSGERRHVQAVLTDWFLAIARERHIMIAVDDVDRIDEPSAAVLAALGHAARRHRLNLVLTRESGDSLSPALELMQRLARPFRLTPLDAGQTELLLRSLFGDVPHVEALATRVFDTAEGSPAVTMALIEHWVENQVVRYEHGSWALPAVLRPEQLPPSLAEAQRSRVRRLSEDARDLAEALSLIEEPGLSAERYPALTAHRDHARTFHALEELLASGMLVRVGERHRFGAPELRAWVHDGLPESRTRALHARIAEAVVDTELAAYRPSHLLLGGHEREALDAIAHRYAQWHRRPGSSDVELLDRAVEVAERLQIPLAGRLQLALHRLSAIAVVGDLTRFRAYAPALIEQAARDSGLNECAALGSSPAPDALALARARVAARHAATPEEQRGWTEPHVISVLMRLWGAHLDIVGVAHEPSLLERLPSLAPLFGAWPVLRVMDACVAIQRAMLHGQHRLSIERCQALLLHLDQHEHELPEALVRAVRLGQRVNLGLFAATSGRPEARDYVLELEQLPVHRVNAWRVRMVYELMLGNAHGAAQCQRRAELLYLQDSGQQQVTVATTRIELLAHVYSDDLIGVKRTLDAIGVLAERYPGWRPTLAVARSQYRRLRGDPAGAFETLQGVLDVVSPGGHMDWWLVAYTHVQVLSELGCAEQAVQYGMAAIERWDAGAFGVVDYGLRQVTAEALLKLGRVAQAREMIDTYIAQHEAAGTHGLRVGLAYETRVRVAIAESDGSAVQHYSSRCAHEYKGGRHFGLLTKYSRLLREADAGGIAVTTGLKRALDTSAEATQTLQGLLSGCDDAGELAQTGLRALLQSSNAESGYLFLLREGRLVCMAASETTDGEAPGLRELLERRLRDAVACGDLTVTDQLEVSLFEPWRDSREREFEPIVLAAYHLDRTVVVGMAAVQTTPEKPPAFRRALIQTLCQTLLSESVVDPLPIKAASA